MHDETNNDIEVTFNPHTRQVKLSMGNCEETFHVTERNRQLFPTKKTETKLTQRKFKQTFFRFLKNHEAFKTLLFNIHSGKARHDLELLQLEIQINQIFMPKHFRLCLLTHVSGLNNKMNAPVTMFYAYILSQ